MLARRLAEEAADPHLKMEGLRDLAAALADRDPPAALEAAERLVRLNDRLETRGYGMAKDRVLLADLLARTGEPDRALRVLKAMPAGRIPAAEPPVAPAELVVTSIQARALIDHGAAEDAMQIYLGRAPAADAGPVRRDYFIESDPLAARMAKLNPDLAGRFRLEMLKKVADIATPQDVRNTFVLIEREQAGSAAAAALREHLLAAHPDSREAGRTAFELAEQARRDGRNAEAIEFFRRARVNAELEPATRRRAGERLRQLGTPPHR